MILNMVLLALDWLTMYFFKQACSKVLVLLCLLYSEMQYICINCKLNGPFPFPLFLKAPTPCWCAISWVPSLLWPVSTDYLNPDGIMTKADVALLSVIDFWQGLLNNSSSWNRPNCKQALNAVVTLILLHLRWDKLLFHHQSRTGGNILFNMAENFGKILPRFISHAWIDGDGLCSCACTSVVAVHRVNELGRSLGTETLSVNCLYLESITAESYPADVTGNDQGQEICWFTPHQPCSLLPKLISLNFWDV